MGIDAKEVCAILWRVIGFSMNTSIRFMRNHPILSGVSLLLLALYILLPSLLFFLIYSSPVLACALVYAREKLGLRFSASYSSGTKSCGGEKNGLRCHLRQQRSVRRNARMKVEEWDSQTSDQEKDKVILTSLYNDLLGRTPHFEESPRAIETNVGEDNDKSFGEEDSRMSSRDSGHLDVLQEQVVCNCEIDGEKYGEPDGKEEMKEEMSNVNENGISEIERNRRLESLIARRRTRRLFKLALDQRNKLQAEEATSPTQNNSLQVTVPRDNNPFEKRRNYPLDSAVMGVQVPGSAPSVMLQGRNPFDIPYDPQEERPNLTGDSFDQEFSLFSQKDMLFCRHESFCRFALFSPEHAQRMNSPVSASDISTTRKRLDLENEYMDHTEQKLPSNGKQATTEDGDKIVESGQDGEREGEMNDETDSNKEEGDDSSCSEDSESEFSHLNKAELREAICHSMDNNPGFLVNQTRNSIPSALPRGLVAPRVDDNNMFYARRCANSHSRTFSIASDMQVEVSETGSPPTTVDWPDDWSNGGESYTYDTDIDREIIRGEESRKRVSQQYESRSGIGPKEENNGLVAKPEQAGLVDDMSLLDRRSQTEEIFEQKPFSSSDLSKPTSSGKFEGLLFRTSVSLSSITEEPETILDPIDGENSENMNCLSELNDQRSLISLDSSPKKLIDEEVADVQQLENDDLCGSPKIIDLNIIDLQKKDQILNSIQREHDTEINMKNHENTEPSEYEATQSLLDASLDTPYIDLLKGETEEEEEEPNLDNFTEEITTKQTENEALQSDLGSSPGHVELLESELMEENDRELVENADDKAKPIEQEENHNLLKASSSEPHTRLVKDYENEENGSDVILLKVQDDNNSTNHETYKEGENSVLLKDLHSESTSEYKNIANVEEAVVSEDTQSSQGSQPWTQQKDQILNSIQGEHDTEINTKKCENTKPREYEATQSLLDASLDTPYIDLLKGETEEEEEPNLDNSTEEITKQTEIETLQSHLGSSPGHVLTELLKSEVMEENDRELLENADDKAKPIEQEKNQNVLKASSSDPHTRLVDDYENEENDSDVILLQVQDDSNSTDHETSREGDNSVLLKDLDAESTSEYKDKAYFEEEAVVSEDTQSSQGSQPWTQQRGVNSPEGVSPRTLENTQQPEHEDDTLSQDIAKDKLAAAAAAAAENNDEENLKPDEHVGEAMEKELEFNLESMHRNTGLIAREDDEDSKKVNGAMHNAETKITEDVNRVLGED